MNFNKDFFKNILPKRPKNSHKGTFGHVLNIAGSEFYTGAAYFSSISALKVGCGLITLASTETVLKTVSMLSPDIILTPITKLLSNKGAPLAQNFQAVSIGCGLSQGVNAVKIFKNAMKILSKSEIPVVIDADGLNILSGLKNTNLPQNTILTPHPKELARLMGVNVENILEQPEVWAKKCCEKFNCTIVLKLHKTIVADSSGNFYENNTGNSALSHGGSGDVLCGMISGFLACGSHSAEQKLTKCQVLGEVELNDSDVRVCDSKLHGSKQGMKIFEACCLAVYLHGLAGELASKDLTEYSTLASDLINYIPQAIKTIIQD